MSIRSSLTALSLILLLGNTSSVSSKEVSVKTLAKTSQSWDGTELPAYPSGKPEITVLDIVIPAGTELPMHLHPVINAGVVITGELHVTKQSGEQLILKSGDPIVELVHQWHKGKAVGNEDVRIIVFYAGEQGKDITVKKH
ncbi:cupin domain-containing protein [Pseudoalteromonas obscura]|uniref:Cupin domain-containing protein n=1 Tax=Pseudoalteromonas obscura TaxID=3048491 RepID=A0ABT7EG92_9GAMM|nr:cupin domain-containing protein [Pseudoalteromonas sp. P94(2023)]MDK2593676.1 cupin domain-containing protein [Pseudoalteromonas sp. P94(2023)]